MTGGQNDIFGRLNSLLPSRWFTGLTPVKDAVLTGIASVLSQIYALYAYARLQTRIATLTDGWIDTASADYFGAGLPRNPGEGDASYLARVQANLLLARVSRPAVVAALTKLTGRAPTVIEPMNPADTGAYGAAVAVSRASTATYIDANGVLQTAGVNVPRYQGGSLLVEAAATNRLLFSNDFTNAAWLPETGVTTTANAGIGLGAALPACSLNEANASQYQRIHATGGAAGQKTVSIYAKAGLRNWLTIDLGPTTYFNLATGTLGSVGAGVTASISPAGNGYYKCTYSYNAPATTVYIGTSSNGADGGLFVGTGGASIYLCGSQDEGGAIATSYIPTLGAPVTRAADIVLNNMTAGSAAAGGYGVAGAYGSMLLPFQSFIIAYRPQTAGIPYVAGYGSPSSGYSTPSYGEYADISMVIGQVPDAAIDAAITAFRPASTVVWSAISS